MKMIAKTVLIAVLLLLTAGPGFAAGVKVTAPDVKSSLKADSNAFSAAAKESAKSKAADTKASAKAKLVDINTATEAQLKAIPGIGDAYAAKIIAGRPYANKAQLKSRNILPANVYEQVKDMIIAKVIKK